MPNVADLYVDVLPRTSRFGPLLDRSLSSVGPRSGVKLGKTLGTRIESEAARNTTGKFLANPSLTRAAGSAGVRVGRSLATGVAKQMGSTIVSRAGTQLGNKLFGKVSERLRGSRWEAALNAPKIFAAAGSAGVRVGRIIAQRASASAKSGLKLDGIGSRAGASLKGGLLSHAGIGGIGGIVASLIGAGVITGAKSLADKASNLNETISKSRNIFGAASKSIESWAQNSANNLGMATGAALEGTSAFGNLFDQLHIGRARSIEMSKGFVQMATDAASFNNADPSEVMDAFLSATRGEYDALQRFVPTASAATIQAEALRLTHKKSTKDLTAADQATALYSVAVRDLGKAHGDFARTSGGFANQQRIFAANWENLQVQIGQYFLPIFTRATVYANTQGFPAFTRIVRVTGDLAVSAGRMGRALLGVFSSRLSGELDKATINLSEIADWLETHQETMVRFFIRLGDGAINFGQALVTLAANGVEGFGRLAGGMADFVEGATPALQGILNGMASVIDIWNHDAAQAIRDGSVKLGEGATAAATGLRSTQISANVAANTIRNKMNPIFDAARNKLHAVGAEEIWKAKQKDAAARASQAIRDIGVKGDATRNKLHGFNVESGYGSAAQLLFAGRVHAARDRLIEQYRTGQKANDTQAALTRRWNIGKDALYRQFIQMKFTKEEAHRLTEQYGRMPGKKETRVSAPGLTGTRDNMRGLDRDINNLNNKTVQIKFGTGTYKVGGVTYHVNLTSPSSAGRARGGILPGRTPLSRGDDIAFPMAQGGIQPLRGGEGITVTEAMQDPYERKRLHEVNQAALSGRSLAPFRDGLASGGAVQVTANVHGDAIRWMREVGMDRLAAGRDAYATALGRQFAGILNKFGDGPVGGAGYVAALNMVKRNNGHPYLFGGVGPSRFDCSGLTGAAQNIIEGRKNPYVRRYVTNQFGAAHFSGLTRNKRSAFMVGVNPGSGKSGHMAGTINGVNIESAGGVGVRWGPRARGWNSPMFPLHYGKATGGVVGDLPWDTVNPRGRNFQPWLAALLGLQTRSFDTGGQLPPGLSLAHNGTGKPETILDPRDRVNSRPITIMIDLGDGLQQRVEGIIDENDEFRASVGRSRG